MHSNYDNEKMIKIDIVSGFLGAGKTTFSNMLLRYYMDLELRPVYIVNEFGEIGLDADIIKAKGFEAVEIDGGCICCTLKDDIATAIIEVINTFSPTNIVFEPSGIFIFDNFLDIFKETEIADNCEIGSVFTVVDSINYAFSKATYEGFIYNQIKNASIIVLSKLERSKCDVDEIISDVKNINPNALIMSKVWREIDGKDLELLLNSPKLEMTNHYSHSHSNLNSLTIKSDREFTRADIDKLISNCVTQKFGTICRVKGFVKTTFRSFLINVTSQDVVLQENNSVFDSRLTFIGEEINEQEISTFLML